MSDVPVLVCTAGALAGATIHVPEGGLDIGRSDDNHVVVRDEGVSRYHARLLYDNGSLWVQDAGSRNGVFVNGVRITGHKALSVGDEIAIAQHRFTVHWADEVEATEPRVQPGPAPAEASVGGSVESPRRRWFWPFS